MLAAAKKEVRECRACIIGKQTRTQFEHRGLERGQRAGEVVHMDTYVVMFTDSARERQVQYGILMMDTYSKEGWTARVSSKDKVIAILKEMGRHCDAPVKRIYSDGGSEFIN